MQTDVLILADGIVAKHLLKRIVKNYVSQNRYYIVYQDSSIKPEIDNENFIFYQFDPTSFVKLSTLFQSKKFKEVVIVLGNKIDTIASFENIRKLDRTINIVILDRWDLQLEDNNYVALNANEILANRVVDHLPNVPVIAQNVGLGYGEIMEVLVPFGSSYVYRHIGSIEQKNWKIAAIYRNNRLLLPTASTMIWPNDLLLLIGEPTVLKEVFKSIKQEVGQFPLPFGINIYLFIDMEELDEESMRRMVMAAVFLHARMNDKKLIIRIANPNSFAFLEFIKRYDDNDIEIRIDYKNQKREYLIESDLKNAKVGLFVTHAAMFIQRDFRKYLYNLHIPVFSIANKPLENLKNAGLILSKNKNLEQISSIVFDIAIQLKLTIKIYEYNEEEYYKEIIDHFQNLANIFSKPITITKCKINPIRKIRQEEENILMVYPFNKRVAKAKIFNIFCTEPEALFHKLNMYHQIFIPQL